MSNTIPCYTLGRRTFIGYLTFLSTFVPLSTDLYLPALPGMAKHFAASPEIINLTLSGFMLVFALSMLLWGPFSDKYGRKPILYTGIALYILASAGTSLSTNVWQLVAGRCVQALGSGAISAVCMAIVKDTFKGRTMENVLAAMQSLMVLAPMLAPVLGGALLQFTSWRGIFWALTACGVLAAVGTLPLRESLAVPQQGSALHTLGRLRVVLRDRGFRSLLLVFSLFSMPFMAYLAVSAYVFQNQFQITPQQYSYFFAANAGCSIFGPLLYVRYFRDVPKNAFFAGCFLTAAASGCLLLLWGEQSPLIFALLYLPITISGGAVRPPSTMLMLHQLDSDNGTVSSLIGSVAILFGSLSMMICSLPWPSFITAAGVVTLTASLVCLAGWLRLYAAENYRQL